MSRRPFLNLHRFSSHTFFGVRFVLLSLIEINQASLVSSSSKNFDSSLLRFRSGTVFVSRRLFSNLHRFSSQKTPPLEV